MARAAFTGALRNLLKITHHLLRHALPPGHILKKDKKRMEEQNRLSKISLEEFIETEVGLAV
jgi:hypothetical protein